MLIRVRSKIPMPLGHVPYTPACRNALFNEVDSYQALGIRPADHLVSPTLGYVFLGSSVLLISYRSI